MKKGQASILVVILLVVIVIISFVVVWDMVIPLVNKESVNIQKNYEGFLVSLFGSGGGSPSTSGGGTSPAPQSTTPCIPQCDGRECGFDSCGGGNCGTCAANQRCSSGKCIGQVVAYYPFEGNANDESGYGNNCEITYYNYPSMLTDGKYGNGYGFSGERDLYSQGDFAHMICGNSSITDFTTQDFTISTWIRIPLPYTNEQNIVSRTPKSWPYNNGYRFYVKGNGKFSSKDSRSLIGFETYQQGAYQHSQSNYDINVAAYDNWNHVAVVRKGSVVKLYINGVDRTFITFINGNYINPASSTEPLLIAKDYLGTIDEVKIWNYALSDENIHSEYKGYDYYADCYDSNKNPMPICTCYDLQKINENLNGSYQLQNDIQCYYAQYWNNVTGFIPIGNSTNPFTGILNGTYEENGTDDLYYLNKTKFTIDYLYINNTIKDYSSLFGDILDANIINVQLIGAFILGRDCSSEDCLIDDRSFPGSDCIANADCGDCGLCYKGYCESTCKSYQECKNNKCVFIYDYFDEKELEYDDILTGNSITGYAAQDPPTQPKLKPSIVPSKPPNVLLWTPNYCTYKWGEGVFCDQEAGGCYVIEDGEKKYLSRQPQRCAPSERKEIGTWSLEEKPTAEDAQDLYSIYPTTLRYIPGIITAFCTTRPDNCNGRGAKPNTRKPYNYPFNFCGIHPKFHSSEPFPIWGSTNIYVKMTMNKDLDKVLSYAYEGGKALKCNQQENYDDVGKVFLENPDPSSPDCSEKVFPDNPYFSYWKLTKKQEDILASYKGSDKELKEALKKINELKETDIEISNEIINAYKDFYKAAKDIAKNCEKNLPSITVNTPSEDIESVIGNKWYTQYDNDIQPALRKLKQTLIDAENEYINTYSDTCCSFKKIIKCEKVDNFLG